MGLLIFYLALSLGVSFLCSLFEAVILSVSPAYAERLGKEGGRRGELLLQLKSNIEDSLSAILTLNTIAHTIGAAGVGAQVLKLWGDSAVAIGSVILTLLVLVLSEIIPKTLGATYWRQIAPWVAYGIRFFIILSYPFVISFKFLSSLLGGGAGHGTAVTREEILFQAELGHREGLLDAKEAKVIQNLLRLKNICAEDVMTPRTVIFALAQDSKCQEVLDEYPSIQFSRIPVYEASIDRLTGFVMRHEIYASCSQGNGQCLLKELINPLHSVPPNEPLSELMEEFIERQTHMFAVVDEHGGLDGIITLEDTIETILGVEIVDESDSVEDMRKYAREQFERRRRKRRGNSANARGGKEAEKETELD